MRLGSLFLAVDTRYNFCDILFSIFSIIVRTNRLHDLMKEYVSLTTAAMKCVKDIFAVIIVAAAKRKKCFTG